MPNHLWDFLLVGLCLSQAAVAATIGPVADLVIANAAIAPDGFSRSTVLAGGQFPGPLITGNKGDRFQINVSDSLTDATMERATSINWHGLFQQGTNFMDGTDSVTQCPIVANDSYIYDFNVPSQAGTFWYHSTVSTQYCDGLRGPLVIYDPNDPNKGLYDVDNESTIITLADWYHLPSPEVKTPFNADSTLINGLGRYPSGPASPLAVVSVQEGMRYRYRLVSMSCNTYYNFSIDGHQMTIIEVDGVNVVPLLVDSIQVFAGQRYSFVLSANQPVGNYWIRAAPQDESSGGGAPGGFAGGINSAILRYAGAPVADPTTAQTPSVLPLLETNLHPVQNPAAPGLPVPDGADVSINLIPGIDSQTMQMTMNGVPFIPPTDPVLLQILSGASSGQDLLPKGSVYQLPPNKVIELSIPGGDTAAYSAFHLHGHSFSVVRSAGSSVYNYVNPVRRDTVSIGSAGDNVTIRFVTDNAGPWFFHSQNNWYLNFGMAVVFAENIPGTPALNAPPQSWDQLCPKYDTQSS